MISGDFLISSAITDGQEKEKKNQAFKIMLKYRVTVTAKKWAAAWPVAGRPSTAPSARAGLVGVSNACALLGVECLELQPLQVLLKTLSFPSIIPLSSLLANSLAKADIFTARSKLYVSATILGGWGEP